MVTDDRPTKVTGLAEFAEYALPWPGRLPTGEEFKALRRALGLTQQYLADTMGVVRVTICRMEANEGGSYRLNEEWPRQVLGAMLEKAIPEWGQWSLDMRERLEFVSSRLAFLASMNDQDY